MGVNEVELKRINTEIVDVRLTIHEDLSTEDAQCMVAAALRFWLEANHIAREDFIQKLLQQPGSD